MTDAEFVTLEGLWTATSPTEANEAGELYYDTISGGTGTEMTGEYFTAFKCGPVDDPEASKQICYKYVESAFVTSLDNNGGSVKAYLLSHTAWTEDFALRTEEITLDSIAEVTGGGTGDGANMLALGAAIAATLATLF